MMILVRRERDFIKDRFPDSRIIHTACALIPRIIFEWERNFTWLELGENEMLPSALCSPSVNSGAASSPPIDAPVRERIPRNTIGVFPSGDFTHWHLLRST